MSHKRRRGKTTAEPESQKIGSGLDLKRISPITKHQSIAFNAWDDGKNLLLIGSAGTGKSFLSLFLASNAMEYGHFNKIVIVRSAVPTRDMGFLPGSVREKAIAYESPYRAMCAELYGRGDAYDVLKNKNIIEFMMTSYVRGITIPSSVVIIDEIQNMNEGELHSVMTRLGNDCRVMLCGDFLQRDLSMKETGFNKFVSIISRMKEFVRVEFGIQDVVRGGLVRSYLMAKEAIETV